MNLAYIIRYEGIIGIIVLLINSTFGRSLRAIKDDEIAAEAMGISAAEELAKSVEEGKLYIPGRIVIPGSVLPGGTVKQAE